MVSSSDMLQCIDYPGDNSHINRRGCSSYLLGLRFGCLLVCSARSTARAFAVPLRVLAQKKMRQEIIDTLRYPDFHARVG